MTIGVIITTFIILYGVLTFIAPKVLDKFNMVYKDEEG